MTPIINNNTFIKLKMKRFETISSSACDNRKKINSIKGAKKINLLLKENKAPISKFRFHLLILIIILCLELFSPDKNLTTSNSQNIQKTYINLQTLQTSREKLSINIYDKSDCEKDYKDKDILTDRGQRTDYLRMNTRNVNANNTHLTFNKLLNNNNNYNININNSNINYNHHSKINNNLTTTKNNNKSIKLNLHQLHSPTKIKYEHPLCASTNDNITNDSLNKDPSPPSVPSIRHSNPLSIITNTTIDENKKYDEVDSRTLSPLTPLANMKINFNSFNFMGKNKNSNISNNSNNEDYTKNTNINNMFVNLHTNTHNTSASSSFKGDSSYPGSDIENFIKNFKGNYENKEKNINDNSGLIKDINNKNISNINNTNNNIKNITKNNTKNNKSNTNNLIRYNTERYIKIDEKPSNSSNFSNVNNVSSGNNGRNVIELGNNKKISSSIDSLTNITENINTINNQNTFNNQNSISSSPEEESDLNNVSNKKNQVNELSSSTILSKSLNSIKISKEIPLIKIINNKPKIINSENLTPNSSREHYSNNLLKNEYNNSEEKYNKYISSKFNNEKFPSFRK